jgi:hypothetical protein
MGDRVSVQNRDITTAKQVTPFFIPFNMRLGATFFRDLYYTIDNDVEFFLRDYSFTVPRYIYSGGLRYNIFSQEQFSIEFFYNQLARQSSPVPTNNESHPKFSGYINAVPAVHPDNYDADWARGSGTSKSRKTLNYCYTAKQSLQVRISGSYSTDASMEVATGWTASGMLLPATLILYGYTLPLGGTK